MKRHPIDYIVVSMSLNELLKMHWNLYGQHIQSSALNTHLSIIIYILKRINQIEQLNFNSGKKITNDTHWTLLYTLSFTEIFEINKSTN